MLHTPNFLNAIHMAKKNKEVAKLSITCSDNDECEVIIDGDSLALTAALAGLMSPESDKEENTFRHMMTMAIELVVEMEKKSKK